MKKPNDLNQRINASAFGSAVNEEKKCVNMNLDDEILLGSQNEVKPVKVVLIPNGLTYAMKSHMDNVLKTVDYEGFTKSINEYDQ